MTILGNLIIALAQVISIVLSLYMWIVIIATLLTWVSPDPYNPIVRFLRSVTEPVFFRIRKVLPFNMGPVDITPIIVILVIIFLKEFVVVSMVDIARGLR